jgi:fatty acid desaturase
VTRRQAWLFFPLLLLEGVNLHVDSNQIEHHLFPSMPRPNLRRAEPMACPLAQHLRT